jgi:DNA invertase Pin-like site-specific DNA recombinase
MKKAVLYARVSSKDQEREGYSIPAQLKLLREYAISKDFRIEREFVDVETAKTAGRRQFGEMVRYFEKNLDCRTVLAEKTDRLYRNFRDALTLEDLGVEIHLLKDGLVLSRESKSQEKLIHGFHLLLAKNYSDNLREEVRKGMREKAAQGIYPSRPPFGYRNNRLERTIEVSAENAAIVRRLFELYGTGKHSLEGVGKQVFQETGRKMLKSTLQRMLKNRFYCGFFTWESKIYQGTHEPLIPVALFDRVQEVFEGHNRPKQKKHEFAFSGLLQCAHDSCAVTAEEKKGKYVYYHCTGYRGKCALPYMREEELGARLGQLIKDIHIPDDVLPMLQSGLQEDQERSNAWRGQERQRLQKRLAALRTRIDQAYVDKLEGKIAEAFWERKSQEWQREEQQVLLAIQGLGEREPDRLLTANRILELANKAHSLYVRQNPMEQGKLLNMVLSNCRIDAASLYPAYRKPFDLIFKAARSEGWWAWGDSNSRQTV